MLARQRQERILEALRASGGVRVSDLTEELQVSYMTIRRDLDALAERGLVDKVHGGATIASQRSADEPGFEAKSLREQPEKEAIAVAAAALVKPGTAIAVTAGTTTWALARYLRDIPNLTVVTNSIPVAQIMRHSGRTDLSVVLTGGLRTPSDALVGPVADAALRNMHVDLLFMGVHGMDERAGLTTPNLLEAETNRALLRSARQLVVVADHTKWGIVGLSTIASLGAADVLVTDSGMPPEAREVLAEHVGELLIAPGQ
ncbi:DeoR/GlpR family DNA-binding transcription regulator [Solirubrobacter phytolaccae]|uniref:DeoR/GlpR family DNA-binding transcription regulator n=1 Tax=Solirubrobacter phytolaccae TaxID=1404360 RepID=A0A9X3SH89_9ACTN|nr:DeoR/GlpR family DNA-binding transcription regulator [Solirubrobacter phytolaccae]MDA0183122.1 DeoR/GlpR family DNA-binding transcription regulator [Solirubrobacter phytolaccae]